MAKSLGGMFVLYQYMDFNYSRSINNRRAVLLYSFYFKFVNFNIFKMAAIAKYLPINLGKLENPDELNNLTIEELRELSNGDSELNKPYLTIETEYFGEKQNIPAMYTSLLGYKETQSDTGIHSKVVGFTVFVTREEKTVKATVSEIKKPK